MTEPNHPSDRQLDHFFPGNSELAARMRALDWSQTPLGDVEGWSPSLKTAVSICLNSRFPMVIWWGQELVLLYNDAWRAIPGNRHPKALGRPGETIFTESWHIVGPQLKGVMETGTATWADDLLIPILRYGYLEEAYYTYSYSPIFIETGAVGGVFTAVAETTERVLGERRLATLRDLADRSSQAKTVDEVYQFMLKTLSKNPADIPFAALYELNSDKLQALLREQTPADSNTITFPKIIDLSDSAPTDVWSLASVLRTQQAVLIDNLAERFSQVPTGVLSLPIDRAFILPIQGSGSEIIGLIAMGINPARAFDADYRNFFTTIAGQIALAITNARAYEEERQRAEALAELDRAKTIFFSNVSHEFRTPLTLMLSPTEDALDDQTIPLPPSQRERIEVVQRNGQRLLKLVNTLLDFSRIEAGRVQAVYEPTDLAAFTAELASVFRSAIERANLRLVVDCPPLPESVYVDREMWEKIVLNLLSNAFKFTFVGEIRVNLQWVEAEADQTDAEKADAEKIDEGCDAPDHSLCPEPPTPKRSAVLEVHDTGIGIPAPELPHLFERFHRVKGAQGRSFEGSGIGLSLVQELVKLHQGTIEVNSVVGEGTCFAIAIPIGTAHLPSDRISASRSLTSTALGVNAYVEEALRWLPVEESLTAAVQVTADQAAADPEVNQEGRIAQNRQPSTLGTARILLADDNADMRDYLKRLLSQQYEVEAVSDGLAAVAAMRQQVPDLVLTDVMMPRLDGFGLLRALRADPQTREVPIILLSARAGEEARVEGLAAGADDYLTKPFSARELLARVEANLKLAQLRQEATQREQTLRLEAEAIRGRLERVLAGIDDQLIVLDREWRYTFVNEQVMTITGKTQAELLGQSFWDIFPEVVGSKFDITIRQAVSEQTVVRVELFYPPFQRWFENRIYPFAEGVTIFISDISDRKFAEQERERLLSQEKAARQDAETANRVKDEFLAVLSHELRSPLNPILGWAKLLQTGQLDEARIQQALNAIARNAQLQSELIEDLLDVSRILRGKLSLTVSPVNLTIPIQSAIETVRLAADAKSITVEAHLEPELGTVLGDATRLQQVAWNLLANAVKFTPTGGRVTVRLAKVWGDRGDKENFFPASPSSSPSPEVSSTGGTPARNFSPSPPPLSPSTYAQITVTDTGKGIHPDFLPHVFDYFRQEDGATTRRFGGLGLGLAIVRQIVELHGGTVSAQSQGEGLGATFTVQLPLMPAQSSTDTNPDSPAGSLNLQSVRVLIVDDEADSRDFIAFVVEQAGATVTTAASAAEALVALTASQFDVLLSDIGMPEMDGYMLMQYVRSLRPEEGGRIIAIALTAYAGEANEQQALQAGFQSHLAKPISSAQLIEAIITVIQRTNNE